MAAGAPTKYTVDLASEICARIADGHSVREICRAADMPAMSTVFLWLATHKEFSEQYELAVQARSAYHAEELLDIADDGSNDWMERKGDDGSVQGWKENGEAIQRSRLRVDTRKWLLSKLQPKKYGDKTAHEHSGPGGGPIELFASFLTEIDGQSRSLPRTQAKAE